MIVLDGPLGTLLHAWGVPTPPPLWSASAIEAHPESLARVHRAYAEAGATVHTAATFRTHRRTAGSEAERLTRAAVTLARDAVPASHRVAGSLAPLEDCYRPDLSPPHPEGEHREHAERLARAGVDLILCETFPHPGEALVATRAAVATGLPTWSALTPGFRADLMPPETLAEAALQLVEAGAEVVLVNCLPARRAGPWVDALVASGVRWGIYANAGDPEEGLQHGTTEAAEDYGRLARGWMARGAEVVGACCGCGPDHVRAIARQARDGSSMDDPPAAR